jgi:hypothetical protein
MGIWNHIDVFQGKKVVDFDPNEGIKNPEELVYRIRFDWDREEEASGMLDVFANDPRAESVKELIIGMPSEDGEEMEVIYEGLLRHAEKMPRLSALFLGDIIDEENMISWITQGHVTPLVQAFPALTYFGVRGAQELSFEGFSHPRLKSLVVQTGGLDRLVLLDILGADLPRLEHLEIWLGTENYGGNTEIDDLMELLEGGLFPNVKVLGLCNADLTDDIANVLLDMGENSIVGRLDELNLSGGTLSASGARALIDNPQIGSLSRLNLRHHFVVKESLQQALLHLGPEVVLGAPETDDADWRYVEAGE